MLLEAKSQADFIDGAAIGQALGRHRGCDPVQAREALAKAQLLGGLDEDEVAALMSIESPELLASCSRRPSA